MTSKDTDNNPANPADAPVAAPVAATEKKPRAKRAAATPSTEAAAEKTGPAKERIAKAMARVGLCSRREAEDWIAAGRVVLNGTVLTSPAVTVGASDRIVVDGTAMPMRERTRLWLYHKPRGLITTTADPEGRATVFDRLPPELPRVVTVGRLDINTEGLLLLTNDGGLARVLELPATGWLRRYRVRAFGAIDEAALATLRDGLVVDGVEYGPIEAEIERQQGSNVWLVIGLREGKNREIKRVLGALGLAVNRLIRVSFGPFQLAEMAEGEVREIRGRVLKDQLGTRLVAESGADFEAPFLTHVGPEEAVKRAKREVRVERASGTGPRGGKGGDAIPRTKLEYAGTGERTRTARARSDDDRPAGARPEKPARVAGKLTLRSEGSRSHEGKGRATGFRDRPDGDARPRPAGGDRPTGPRGPRPEGGAPRPPRAGSFRDRPEGTREERGPRPDWKKREDGPRPPRSGGFRDRPEGGQGDRPRGPRPEGGAPRPPRAGGFRDRPDGAQGDRPSRGPRPEGGAPRPPRAGGFRDRPEGGQGDRPSRGPRPEGGASRPPRAGGFRDRPEGAQGDRPRGPRPEGGPMKRRPHVFSESGEDMGEHRPTRDEGPRDRPAGGGGDRRPPRGDAPQRSGGADRPAGGGRPGGKPGGFGGKPGGKPGGFGGKPGGKPGGFGGKPRGGAGGGSGGRPSGGPAGGRGKPSGGKGADRRR